MVRLLEPQGYTVVEASSGEEALDLAAQRRFSAALVDINMPGISGLEVLRHLTDEYPDIAVIMVTATFDLSTAIESMKMGAYDYIVKPFTVRDVLDKLAKAMRRAEIRSTGKHYQQDLERRVEAKEVQLRTQFTELTQALVREHEALYVAGGETVNETSSKGRIITPALTSRQESPSRKRFKGGLSRFLRRPKP